MAGHSHSANIRFRKGRQDEARGRIFSKLAREIISAAREGGGDPSANLRLRYAIDRARSQSMPKDNIERAIKKGTGELGGAALEELLYEGYAPGGVAILVEALTDNRNRTAPEVKKAFEKRGGSFAASGAVAWMFERKSLIVILRESCDLDEDAMMELVLEAGAEDLEVEEESFTIKAEPSDFHSLVQAISDKGLEPAEASITWIAKNTSPVEDPKQAKQVLELIDLLEELEDVTAVSANYEIDDAILEEHANG